MSNKPLVNPKYALTTSLKKTDTLNVHIRIQLICSAIRCPYLRVQDKRALISQVSRAYGRETKPRLFIKAAERAVQWRQQVNLLDALKTRTLS
ncbi:hypothetical protein CEXT_100581 [Caerostris extrusa]|uniref:LAGLIDADG homing endonuclease n=1 Tax=Caerostris extrusa TaxID=172846 RepID=A0AAV4T0G6_CAEEX|nr:hypothetical protein CEXT_100581 [Caerostris extrusa]